MRAVRLWGNKKLRFALIGVAVAVLVGMVWSVWPRGLEDLTLHIRIGHNAIRNGRPVTGFLVEGADRYEISIRRINYLFNEKLSHPNGEIFLSDSPIRYFTTPQTGPGGISDQGYKLEVRVWVFAPYGKNPVRKLLEVLSDTWRFHSTFKANRSKISIVEEFWKSGRHIISEQTITSDLITNTFSTAEFIWKQSPRGAIDKEVITTDAITNTPPH